MKRTLVISIEVGDAEVSGCGECPFKVVDYDMGGPRGGALLCMNPAWHVDDVTVRRRDECVRAEENAGSLDVARMARWLLSGGPCVEPGGTIYGPYQDALDIVAEALVAGERGEP